MAIERRVKRSGKDTHGNITSLCGDWGTATKGTAIAEIDAKTCVYFVEEQLPRVTVVVYAEGGTKHLKTTKDATNKNNLDKLPAC